MTARLSAIEREALRKLMAWYEAQKRGRAVQEADAVLAVCVRMEARKAWTSGIAPDGLDD